MAAPTTVRILQTADNALRLLLYLGESGQPRSLAEIAQAMDLAKSVTHSLLVTMKLRGFVTQNPDTRQYGLGLQLVTLGQAASRRLDLRNVAHPLMAELAVLTGESVYLMVPGRNHCVLLDRADPPNPIKVTMEVGQEGRFHAGSSNKAVLAYLPDAEIDRIIREVGLPALAEATPTDQATLREQIGEIRRLGYSYTEQESFEGIAGIAAPIFGAGGRLVGSVGLGGLVQRLGPRREELARAVMQTAAEISRLLGHG